MKKPKPAPTAPEEPSAGAAQEDHGEMVGTERSAPRSQATGPPVLRLAVPAKSGRSAKRKRGRLSRTVLAALGKGLEDCFDEIRKQEVPERFKLLLQQF